MIPVDRDLTKTVNANSPPDLYQPRLCVCPVLHAEKGSFYKKVHFISRMAQSHQDASRFWASLKLRCYLSFSARPGWGEIVSLLK